MNTETPLHETIISVLEEINPGVDYEGCATLIDERYIDSLAMVALIAELEDAFDISIPPAEISADNFNSVDAMSILISRLIEQENA